MSEIVLENVSFYHGKDTPYEIKALKNINLTIEEGDFFGIVGHTGSGKSTFIQHLNGLLKIGKNKGSLKVGDFNLSDKNCDFKALRSKVGMVFQYPEYQLFADSVKADVLFALNNFFPKLSESEKEEKVRRAIELVGLDYEEVKDKSPFDLSGGQKRRVAIAGVIVAEPEILVLDEPVAGLDPQGKNDFLKLLHSLKKSLVKTIVIVSHDMNLVSENCNKIAVFSQGQIYAVGTPNEIFSRYDEIENLGLELPVTACVKRALESKNIRIEGDLKLDDFVNAVAKKFTMRGER